jgi:predicted nucleic acid-binding protein
MEQWFVPVIAIAEIQKGVAKLRRVGAAARADRLEKWLHDILEEYDGRVVPITESIARRVGDMEDAAIAKGRSPGLPDILIASTALELGLTVVTANSRHFEYLDVANLNPFAE